MKISSKQSEIQKKGYNLAKTVFEITNKFQKEDLRELASQLRNTAMFIPSNISEAVIHKAKKKAAVYLVVARGFLSKLDTDIGRSRIKGIIDTKNYKDIETQIRTIDYLLAGLLLDKRIRN